MSASTLLAPSRWCALLPPALLQVRFRWFLAGMGLRSLGMLLQSSVSHLSMIGCMLLGGGTLSDTCSRVSLLRWLSVSGVMTPLLLLLLTGMLAESIGIGRTCLLVAGCAAIGSKR